MSGNFLFLERVEREVEGDGGVEGGLVSLALLVFLDLGAGGGVLRCVGGGGGVQCGLI